MPHYVRIFFCALLLIACPAFAQAQTAGREELRGHIPEAVKRLNLQPLGRLSSSNRLHLAIGLPLHDPDGAKAFIQQLYDPSSPRYHQYLTTEQFAEEFGPTADDYQAAINFARAHGFTVTQTYRGRLLVDVDAAVSDVESAFQVRMFEYQHPTEHRRFYAPDVEPSVPPGVKILDISGLSSYPSPHPNSHIMQPSSQGSSPHPTAGSIFGGQYIGNDFRAAYVPGSPLTGLGQSVALVQFDNYHPNDITNYVNLAGLSFVPLTNIFLDHYTGTIGDGNGEVSLDIEQVIAMAPGVSKIYLYEGNPTPPNFIPNDVLQQIADDNNSKQISCSWGWNSGPTATTDNIFIEMASHGQSFFVASGDSGAYPGSSVDNTCQTCFGTPAASPYVTSVGGTTLSTAGPSSNWTGEVVWNWFTEFQTNIYDGVASSGGYSAFYSTPSWQQGVNPSNLGSPTGRNFPDVAMTGDHVFVVYGNGSEGWFGGTSCASPLWAGFIALVNQQGVFNSKPPVGFLNPAIYTISTGTSYTACFHDITTGNNEWSSSPSAYTALSGFDLCTGWGSPTGTNLINALVGAPVAVPIIVTAGSTLTAEGCPSPNGAIDPGETVTVNFLLQNTGSADASNIVATLLTTNGVTAPSAPQTYGVLMAGGPAVTGSFTFTATGQCGSNIIATLQIQNLATNLGNVAFPFSLGAISAATNSFANTGNISIPTSGNNGRSTPYPSTITVSGLGSTVSKVTMTVTNLSHTWPADIDMLLVGPGGQKILLMSAAGGDNGNTPISNVTVTFDDAAVSKLPQNTVITSGTYLPTDYLRGDVLSSPAPVRPYAPALSTFNGVNPNGTWSLYVFDDFAPADGGSIANGWILNIVTTTNSCCIGGGSNHPPVISAASINPVSPTTTNILTVTGISTNDPDGNPITLAYQWQQSTNNVTFTNIAFVANTLPAAATIAGDYYRVTITPNDGQTNGAPFTTASVLVPVDADGNGINDDWEVQYFGHIGINPNADADGTGQKNLFKYVAGLDPTNPASVFIFQIAAITNQPTQNKLLFNPLASGRTYTPQFNTDLVFGSWLPLPGYLGPLTNGNQATITDTNATGPHKFYRLDISLP